MTRPSPETAAVLLADAISQWGGCFFHCGDDGTAFDLIRDTRGWDPHDAIRTALADLVATAREDERQAMTKETR